MAVAIGLYCLYLFGLGRCGLLGPDEPRYAAIGRAMAATGDWVTPHLWGKPWFEKPPLLYWMTAAGIDAGLGLEWGPRLPVALTSVGFLVFFWIWMKRAFGPREAWLSGVILGTSAAWLIYSHVAVTDLYLSVCFGAAVLLAVQARESARAALWAGVWLGCAVLAKGLVPVVLFAPVVLLLRRQLWRLITIAAVALAVATPWYALVIAKNGSAFVDEFFWRQQFSRMSSPTLAHVQPFWFYVPVLLAGLFPWTPLLALLGGRNWWKEDRLRWLAGIALWGLVFFSAALNKLPGYVLPLFPLIAAVLGVAVARTTAGAAKTAALFGIAGGLLAVFPYVNSKLPHWLGAAEVVDRSGAFLFWSAVAGLALGAWLWWVERDHGTGTASAVVAAGMAVGVVLTVWVTYPVLDFGATARGSFRKRTREFVCVDYGNRSWRYTVDYYADRDLPDCSSELK